MTPGSVLGSPGPPSLNDSDHQLLRDNIGMCVGCVRSSVAMVTPSRRLQDALLSAGPNPSHNTSLPSPGAWSYSASDSPLSNAHSTGMFERNNL